MADKTGKSGYVGKIANAGTQMVKAPELIKGKKGKGNVKKGTDLRTGK